MQQTYPQRRTNIEVKDIANETLLIDGEDIHVLNPTAGLIWKLCDGGHSLADMAAALGEEYDIPSDHDLHADIERTLQNFKAKGLLSES
jgi:hypothetical protein